MSSTLMDKINQTVSVLKEKISSIDPNLNDSNWKPDICLTLGSGITPDKIDLNVKAVIPFTELPNIPKTSVIGHKGEILIASKDLKDGNSKELIVLCGRHHFYEGHDPANVVFLLRVCRSLGATSFIATNAAGGISPDYTPGDIVAIKDHVNLSGINPLRGANLEEFGTRFPDMSDAYGLEKRTQIINEVRTQHSLEIAQGVYGFMPGPSYETPAEIKMLATLGCDLVGMSTVPEVIAANHMQMKTLGFSCVTNAAAGVSTEKLDHKDVKDVALMASEKLSLVLKTAIELI